MNSKKHTWSPERQMEIPRVRKIDGEIERSVRSEWVGFASVCMRAPTFPCAPSTPLLAPVCRFVFFVSLKRMHVFKECLCTRVWLCVGCSSGGGKGFAKDIKKGKKTFFFFFSHLCASAVVPASVPSAMGTKTTVTTHSFSWRAVACGRIGDFSQGYLWHCWSLILRVGALCRPIPRPCHSPSHIQQNPFLYLAISLSPSFHLMFSLVDQYEYWWAHV